MAEVFPSDIYEQILVRLRVKDLTRFKSVSTSWYSLISDSRFVKNQLKHAYKTNEISRYGKIHINPLRLCNVKNDIIEDYNNCHIVGSCNGLVCLIRSNADILVANPVTREVKKLQKPIYPYNTFYSRVYCSSFGYDSSIDDYKVVLGFTTDLCHTFFQVLTLRSNVLKVIGKVNYVTGKKGVRDGIFCNGSLHWLMYDNPNWLMDEDPNCKQVILSFDLSKEKFKVIPQPDDSRYEYSSDIRLGVTEDDCLCIVFRDKKYGWWVLKNDNGKQSWEFERVNDHREHFRRDFLPPKSFDNHLGIWLSTHDDKSRLRFFAASKIVPSSLFVDKKNHSLVFINSHVFRESLVSPHSNDGKLRRKRPEIDSRNKSRKVGYNRATEIRRFPAFVESHVFLKSAGLPRFESGRLKRKRDVMDSSNKVGYTEFEVANDFS